MLCFGLQRTGDRELENTLKMCIPVQDFSFLGKRLDDNGIYIIFAVKNE